MVDFVVDFSGTNQTYGFNIWVDWNDDLDFDDAGEEVYNSGAFITNIAASFPVPQTAAVGQHRMRIRNNFFSSNPSACGTITSGETEDYILEVTPVDCADDPSNIQISSIGTTTATLTWTTASTVLLAADTKSGASDGM